MKRPLLNKLGTILNTVGSLGVGYYLAKFNLLTSFDISSMTDFNWLQLGGSAAILGVGLLLRIKDMSNRKKEAQMLDEQLHTADEGWIATNEKLNNLKLIVQTVIEDQVEVAVADEVSRVLETKDSDELLLEYDEK